MYLFNLSYATNIFGPLQHFFEGIYGKEGYVRYVKLNMKLVRKATGNTTHLKKDCYKNLCILQREIMILKEGIKMKMTHRSNIGIIFLYQVEK